MNPENPESTKQVTLDIEIPKGFMPTGEYRLPELGDYIWFKGRPWLITKDSDDRITKESKIILVKTPPVRKIKGYHVFKFNGFSWVHRFETSFNISSFKPIELKCENTYISLYGNTNIYYITEYEASENTTKNTGE